VGPGATRETLRGAHLGEGWDLPLTGNRVEGEFLDNFRLRDGKLVEHGTPMDCVALRVQMFFARVRIDFIILKSY
jgi:hypothetical protein